MASDELFIRESGQQTTREVLPAEQSPSPLASYVLKVMPIDLELVGQTEEGRLMSYGDLATKQAAVLEEARPTIEANQDHETARITQMDMLFMFGGFIPTGNAMYEAAPPNLMPLIHHQADRFSGLETFMSYDTIIDLNAAEYARAGHIRVFSTGERANMERDFYIGHNAAEPNVRDAAYGLHQLVENPQLFQHPEEVFAEANAKIQELVKYMQRYHQLPNNDFDTFRAYLGEYADGTRNASGAFMPSVQLFELALHKPTTQFNKFIDTSMRYFPAWSQAPISQWREQSLAGNNIVDLIQDGKLVLDDEGKTQLEGLIKSFERYKTVHLRVTHRKIPGAFAVTPQAVTDHLSTHTQEEDITEAGEMGSGGYNIPHILMNGVRRMKALRQRVTTLGSNSEG